MDIYPENLEQDEPKKSIITSRDQLNHVRDYLKNLVQVKYTEDDIPTDPSLINKLEPISDQTSNEPSVE